MDIPNLKDITRKLGILKDYSSLVAPIAIVLAAVLLLILGQMLSGNLRKQITRKSISDGAGRIRSLIKHPVSGKQWEIERDYQQAYKADAEQIADLSKQSSQRQLLSYNIFPEPEDKSQMIFEDFGEHYRGKIENLLKSIDAVDRPTDIELGNRSGGVARGARRASRDKTSDIRNMVTDALCCSKAESGSVYANASDISGYEYWNSYEYTGMETAVTDCWYWQLAYWIIEDVIDTIDAVNFGFGRVYTSPVKRLMSINFTGAGSTDGKPHYVTSASDSLTQSLTKRYSDSDINVVHFNVVALVSTKAVLPFMDKLCSSKKHKFSGFSGDSEQRSSRHNQITVLRSSVESIDLKDKDHEFYRYGAEDEIVKLNLICEYIFNKSGYDEIKPTPVKEYMGELSPKTSASGKDSQPSAKGKSSRSSRSKAVQNDR